MKPKTEIIQQIIGKINLTLHELPRYTKLNQPYERKQLQIAKHMLKRLVDLEECDLSLSTLTLIMWRLRTWPWAWGAWEMLKDSD